MSDVIITDDRYQLTIVEENVLIIKITDVAVQTGGGGGDGTVQSVNDILPDPAGNITLPLDFDPAGTAAGLVSDLANTLGTAAGADVGDFAAALTADQNYVTDAEKAALHGQNDSNSSSAPVGHLTDAAAHAATVQTLTNKTLNDNTNYIDADATHAKVKLALSGSSTIGMPVQATVWNVTAGAIEVAKCASNTLTRCMGLMETAGADGTIGSVRTAGLLTGVNTSAWSEGAKLYVSSAGTLTATPPSGAGIYVKAVGTCLYQSATVGVIDVHIEYVDVGDFVNPMTTAGDIIIGDTAGIPLRLAKGTALQQLRMNAGATAPEWAAPNSLLVYETTLAADTAEINITGLDGNAAGGYIVQIHGFFDNVAAALFMKLNGTAYSNGLGDCAAAMIYSAAANGNALTSVQTGLTTGIFVLASHATVGNPVFTVCQISPSVNNKIATYSYYPIANTNGQVGFVSGKFSQVIANVTAINLACNSTYKLRAGSIIQVYRRK